MDEGPKRLCYNCKKYIGEANFSIHSAFCQRNIFICKVCKEPIPKNSMKEHGKDCHQELKPVKIHHPLFKRNPFVKDDLMLVKSSSPPVKTLNQELNPVKLHHPLFKKNPIVTDDIKFPSSVKPSAPPLQTLNQSSQNHTVCHTCKQSILWNEYNQHTEVCTMENLFRKGPGCNENIQSFAWMNNSNKTCRELNDSKPQVNKSESTPICRSQSIQTFPPLPSTVHAFSAFPVSYINGRPAYSSAIRAQMSKVNETITCPFCKKQLHLAAMQEHIDFCSKRYFLCELCCEQVLREDRDTHLTSQCKMLQDIISSDFYDCPLCGEHLPKKDKAVHDFLACKTLLQIFDPLYSSQNENTSKNCAKETQRKKICPYCDKELHVDTSEELHFKVCEVYKQIDSDCSHVPPKTHHDSASVDKLRCIICLNQERDTAFEPCGHLVVCSSCSKNVKSRCPMCRSHIQKTIKIYMN